MAVRHRPWIDHDRARQSGVGKRGTQKLCVSRRSIETLIQARGGRRDQFTVWPRQGPRLVHAARERKHQRHEAAVEAVGPNDPGEASMRRPIHGRCGTLLEPLIQLGERAARFVRIDDP